MLLSIRLALLIPLFLCSTAYAQSIFRLRGSTGIEWSHSEWAVAGNINGSSPNIFSELRWRKLSGMNYDISASLERARISYFIRSSFSPGLNGTVEDTDYGGDNRTDPQYQESFSSTGGRRLIAETGVKFSLRENSRSNTQLRTGIRYNNQRLFIDQQPNNIQSYYDSRWTGIFLGIEKDFRVNHMITLHLLTDADLSDYYGYGNWKLRQELAHPKSFIHHAVGYGVNTKITAGIQLNQSVNLTTSLAGWWNDTFKGKDIVYYQDGQSVSTQLNGVKSFGAGFHIGFSIVL